MLDKQITNPDILSLSSTGRIIALDLGTKKVGVAICDEMQMTTRPLPVIKRGSWKELLKETVLLIEQFDAIALVLGLPVNFDGTENEMSQEARRLHRNYSLSVKIPVFLQDERLTTKFAQQDLYERGYKLKEILKKIDGEAAMLILEDFLALKNDLQNQLKLNNSDSELQ